MAVLVERLRLLRALLARRLAARLELLVRLR
jgi:hypothetical protein